MEDEKQQFDAIKAVWAVVRKNALSDPTAWKPHLPYSNLSIVDEAVEMVSTWVQRVRAPNGFSTGYHLAKSVALTQLPGLLDTAKQLEAGKYNFLPSFVNQLVNILSAIHTMAVYAPKNKNKSVNADLSAELAQALSLLNTAQDELSKKVELLDESEKVCEAVQECYEAADKVRDSVGLSEEEVEKRKGHIREIHDLVDNDLKEIVALKEEFIVRVGEHKKKYELALDGHDEDYGRLVSEHGKAYETLLGEHQDEYASMLDEFESKQSVIVQSNVDLNADLVEMKEELERLQEKCREQEGVIDSILPRGASAGLASAFAIRGKQLEGTKWVWLVLFVSSLISLSVFANSLIGLEVADGSSYWDQLLGRMPLVAPLVWLGWFSAIQYGNIIRVQEDYAFKEATSKAFQGYRDHMEHLRSVDLDGAQTALTLLSETTINVLGKEPLRIYGKTEQDASPTHSLAQLVGWREKKSKRNPEEGVDETV